MRQHRRVIAFAAIAALIPLAATADTGPTRVRDGLPTAGPPARFIAVDSPSPFYPPAAPLGYPGPSATPDILSRVGEILGAIDSPQERSQLAQQWLDYAKKAIAKDQQFRDDWLQLQRQQLAQMQETEQTRLQVTQLQAKIEELRAQNLQLQQENLRMQQKLAQAGAGQLPPASGPAPQAR